MEYGIHHIQKTSSLVVLSVPIEAIRWPIRLCSFHAQQRVFDTDPLTTWFAAMFDTFHVLNSPSLSLRNSFQGVAFRTEIITIASLQGFSVSSWSSYGEGLHHGLGRTKEGPPVCTVGLGFRV